MSPSNKTVLSFFDLYLPVISDPDDLNTAKFSLNFCLHGETASLATQSYSQYQIKIAEIIDDKRNNGWMYNSIAKLLDERGFRTPRDKTFTARHAERIHKKYLGRNERRSLPLTWEIKDASIGEIRKSINKEQIKLKMRGKKPDYDIIDANARLCIG